jgi:hypothetical protein
LAVDGRVVAAVLLDLDWTPLPADTVRHGRATWGQCLEFAHAGPRCKSPATAARPRAANAPPMTA